MQQTRASVARAYPCIEVVNAPTPSSVTSREPIKPIQAHARDLKPSRWGEVEVELSRCSGKRECNAPRWFLIVDLVLSQLWPMEELETRD